MIKSSAFFPGFRVFAGAKIIINSDKTTMRKENILNKIATESGT